MNKHKLIQARIKKMYGKQDGFTRFGIIWLIIISPFWIIPLIHVIYQNPYEVLKCWPAALFLCLTGFFLFLFKKYPDFFINKVTLFPVKIMIYTLSYTLIIGSGLFLIFMTSRLLGFTIDALKIAILKCFWIIK